MHSPLPICSTDHAEHTAEESTKAIAALLAAGLLRLPPCPTPPVGSDHKKPSEFYTNDLAVCGEKSVTVHAG